MNGLLLRRRSEADGDYSMADDTSTSSTPAYDKFDRVELTRLLIKTLQEIGMKESATCLASESGVQLESPLVGTLRDTLLAGKWQEALQALKRIPFRRPSCVQEAQFLIHQQHIVELLMQNDSVNALRVLRTNLTPLGLYTAKVQELSGLLMMPKSDVLTHFKGKSVTRLRRELSEAILALVHTSAHVPSGRLAELLAQAIEFQGVQCLYHNVVLQGHGLLEDHSCRRSGLPRRVVHNLDQHTDEVWQVRFNPQGTLLATGCRDGTVRVFDGKTFQLKQTLTAHGSPVSFICWSTDGTRLITCSMDTDKRALVWDARNGVLQFAMNDHRAPPSTAAFSCRDKIATGSPDKTVCLRDSEGKVERVWNDIRPSDVAFTPDGTKLVVACHERKIRVLDVSSGKEELVQQEQASMTSLSISADGEFVLLNLSNQTIHLRRLSNLALVHKYEGHQQTKFSLRSCFGGHDQTFVASGSEDACVYIWHRTNETCVETLPGHGGVVNDVSWHPTNPSLLASASDDRTVRIWGPDESTTQDDEPHENGANGRVQ